MLRGDFITSNDDEMRTILVGLLMGAQDNIAAPHVIRWQSPLSAACDIGAGIQDFNGFGDHKNIL